MRDVRRRVLRCNSDVSELEAARRRKALAAIEKAKRLIALGRKREAMGVLLGVVLCAGENGAGWVVSDASGKLPHHVRAWELISECCDDEREGAAAKAAARLAARELNLIGSGVSAIKGGSYSKAAVGFRAAEKAGLAYASAVRKTVGKAGRMPVAALICLGYAHALAKDYTGAMVAFGKALRLDPENAEALGAKGSLLDLQGKHNDAERCYARVREMLSDELAKGRDGGDAF